MNNLIYIIKNNKYIKSNIRKELKDLGATFFGINNDGIIEIICVKDEISIDKIKEKYKNEIDNKYIKIDNANINIEFTILRD